MATVFQLMRMKEWNQENVSIVIKTLGNKSYRASVNLSTNRYEIYELTGEVNKLEFNQAKGKDGGNENKHFLAKVIVAGLKEGGAGGK
ncbi:MAG: hypothetical protein WCK35_14250 [Chloroflexota bacterium]